MIYFSISENVSVVIKFSSKGVLSSIFSLICFKTMLNKDLVYYAFRKHSMYSEQIKLAKCCVFRLYCSFWSFLKRIRGVVIRKNGRYIHSKNYIQIYCCVFSVLLFKLLIYISQIMSCIWKLNEFQERINDVLTQLVLWKLDLRQYQNQIGFIFCTMWEFTFQQTQELAIFIWIV